MNPTDKKKDEYFELYKNWIQTTDSNFTTRMKRHYWLQLKAQKLDIPPEKLYEEFEERLPEKLRMLEKKSRGCE